MTLGVERVRVVTAHEIPDRPPLQLAVGDVVAVDPRDTDWPAFVFVTDPRGAGWVPARHLSGAEGDVVVEVGYDTTEIPTEVDEVLDVVARDDESGWLWCRKDDGREGWVPIRTVVPA